MPRLSSAEGKALRRRCLELGMEFRGLDLQGERVAYTTLRSTPKTSIHPPSPALQCLCGSILELTLEGPTESVSEFWAGWDKAKLCLAPPDPDSHGEEQAASFFPSFPTSPLP